MTKRTADELETESIKVKQEMHTPKHMCLNSSLKESKKEPASPRSPAMLHPEAIQTPSVALASPDSSRPTPVVWKTQLRTKMSNLAVSLLSPSPTGQKRTVAPLEADAPPGSIGGITSVTANGCNSQLLENDGTGGKHSHGTTESKQINNAFNMQKKHLDNDALLKQHNDELLDVYGRGNPELMNFKKLVGSAKKGMFEVIPQLRVIHKQTKIKNWGKNVRLGSWKEVVDKHGEDVDYTALRQGTLAHVPPTPYLKRGTG